MHSPPRLRHSSISCPGFQIMDVCLYLSASGMLGLPTAESLHHFVVMWPSQAPNKGVRLFSPPWAWDTNKWDSAAHCCEAKWSWWGLTAQVNCEWVWLCRWVKRGVSDDEFGAEWTLMSLSLSLSESQRFSQSPLEQLLSHRWVGSDSLNKMKLFLLKWHNVFSYYIFRVSNHF